MNFSSPSFLWFLPAIAVPAILHFLHRRKPRAMPFSSLELIKLAHRTRMPKRRLRDLLLLLMRTLLVLFAVLLFSRPVVRHSAALSGGGKSRVVILLDVSASMDATYSGRSRLDTAKDEARRLLRIVSADTEVGLVTFSDRVETELTPATDRTRLVGGLTSAKALARPTNILPALKAGSPMLAGAETKTLVILSDQAMNVWTAAAAAAGAWEGFDPAARVIVRQCGEAPVSRAVTAAELQLSEEGALRGKAVFFTNDGAPLADWTVELNERVVAKGNGSGAGVREEAFEARLPDGGFYGGKVFLTPDEMTADDAFYVAGRVPKGFRVLLVDGEPGVAPSDSEVYYLKSALESPRDPRVESIDTVSADGLSGVTLKNYGAIVLSNAADLAGREAELRQWVEEGGGLFLSAGSRWPKSRSFVLGLFSSGGLRDGDAKVVAPTAHGILAGVAGLSTFDWKQVSASHHVLPEGGASFDTLIAFEDGSPLLLQESVGKGNLVVLTTTMDRAWSNLPSKPVFAPLMRELLAALADPYREQTSLQAFVDEPAHIHVPEGTRSVTVVSPGGASSGAGIDHEGRMEWTPPPVPGLYEIRTDRPDQWFKVAVNMRGIATEADSRMVREADVRAALPGAAIDVLPYRAEDHGLENALEGKDVTGLLIILVALLLITETVLSWPRKEARA